MAGQPYNYSLPNIDVFGEYQKGVAEKQKAEQDALRIAQQQQYDKERRAVFDDVLRDPNQQNVFRASQYIDKPDQLKSLNQFASALDNQSKHKAYNQVAPLGHALMSGSYDSAIKIAERRASAFAGIDDQASQEARELAQMIRDNPAQAVITVSSTLGELNPDGVKRLYEITGEMRSQAKERRDVQQSAVELRQKSAEAIIKEAEANLAPDVVGAQLGLTKAQIGQANAAMRASNAAAAQSGAAARRADAEARQIGSGVIPADKRPEAETKFRTEYNNQTKPYQEVKASYGRILSAEDSAVGDLALVYGYMKMLDPGSVVREGEFATAENSGGIPEKLRNIYNKALNGERLQQSQRSAFKGQAQQLYKSAQQQEQQVRDGIGRIAKGYGLNTDNIFYSATDIAPMAPQQQQPQPSVRASAQFTPRQPAAQNIRVDF